MEGITVRTKVAKLPGAENISTAYCSVAVTEVGVNCRFRFIQDVHFLAEEFCFGDLCSKENFLF
jgi:hypothetical protein